MGRVDFDDVMDDEDEDEKPAPSAIDSLLLPPPKTIDPVKPVYIKPQQIAAPKDIAVSKTAPVELPKELTPEERKLALGKLLESYNSPVDYESPIREQQTRSKWADLIASVGEGLSGLARAKSQAMGGPGVDHASYDRLRAANSAKVDAVTKQQDAKRKSDMDARLKDPGSPESRQARLMWAQFYKDANGSLPEGFDELSAEALSSGNSKAVLEQLKARQALRLKNADIEHGNTLQENQKNRTEASLGVKVASDQAKIDQDADKTNAKAAQDADKNRTAIENSGRYLGVKVNSKNLDTKQELAQADVEGWELADPAKRRPSTSEATKAREADATVKNINRDVDRLAELYKSDRGRLVLPTAQRAEAASIASRLIFKIGTVDAKGALQAPELALVRQYVPDFGKEGVVKDGITAMFGEMTDEEASRFLTQIATLKKSVNADQDNRMTNLGYKRREQQGPVKSAEEQKPADQQPPATPSKSPPQLPSASTKQDLKAIPEGGVVVYSGADIKDRDGNIIIHSGSKVKSLGKGQFEEVK